MHVYYRVVLTRWDRLPSAVKYVLPRIGALVVAWLLATMAIFFLLFVATDPINHYLPRSASQQQRAELRHRIGIDKPAVRLYADWMRDFLHGDLGTSSPANRSVSGLVKRDAQP